MNGNSLSPDELNREIRQILDRGLIQPKSLRQHLLGLHRALGFRYLFFDTGITWVIAALTVLLMVLFCPPPGHNHLYAVLFLVSPICFLIIMLLTETIEKVSGLYELKMTLTYTVRQLAVLRILYFSFIGMLFSVLTSLYFSHSLQIAGTFLKLLSLSLSALFLCGFVTVFVMRHFHSTWSHLGALLYWFLFGLMPYVCFSTRWNAFLEQLPLTITAVAALGSMIMMLIEVRKNLILHTSEVM